MFSPHTTNDMRNSWASSDVAFLERDRLAPGGGEQIVVELVSPGAVSFDGQNGQYTRIGISYMPCRYTDG